ncbi:Ig-like domain-containing protein [Botrimarina sp.]|uniref:Ig-like domain-containing protein n=1 Tax=Botrimarina sp. TaxID=2795802 RepID=UPI0032EBC985
MQLAVESLEARTMFSANPGLLSGDYDLNNTVDGEDYVVWANQYGAAGEGLLADGNADGLVNAADYTIWRDNYGATRENTPPNTVDDSISINHGQTAAILASQSLANDCDPEGGPLSIVRGLSASGGSVELRDGVFFFTPDGSGAPLRFDYVVADAAGAESTASVSLSMRPPTHGSPDDGTRAAEHMALLRLIDTIDATNVAVRSGSWSDPTIWSAGAAPGSGERVLIHNAVEVTYDVQSDTPLEWLRVDGVLTFRHDQPTRVVVETFVSDPLGTINLGTAAQAIDAEVTAEVLIDTSGGPLSQTEDPTLIGRGFISHGETNVYGAAKQEFTTLAGDAAAGEAFIELTDSLLPAGWRIGDTLLLVGTEANPALLNTANQAAAIVAADAENSRFGDELLEITGMSVVDGRVRVTFRNVTNQSAIDSGLTTLLWNHQRPDGETFDPDELSIHVANLTRNVVVRSSDPDVPIQQRGHFMVMHNTNAEVHHAQFKDLGRTDKRLVVDDPAVIGNFDGSPGTGTNPRGRYGLHLHRLGANDLDGVAAQVTGNVVWGTPGWGIVHHDSHAVLEDNVVFDVVGAGIVAEDGNELGLWRNNLVVKTTGDLVNDFDDGAFFQTLRGPRFDLGFVGSGYWVQGGGFGIRLEDNIAASTNGAGFDLVHNTDLLANVELISVELVADPVVRQALVDAGFTQVTPNNVPTRGADGLVAYNGYRGIHTWLHNRDSGDMEGQFTFPTRLAHDFRSTIENFTVWGVQTGVQNFYSTRFDFRNGLVVGDPDAPVPYFASPGQQANNSEGVGISHNHEEANNILFDGLRLEGFEYGFQVFSPFNDRLQEMSPYAVSELRNASVASVEHAFMPTNGSNPSSLTHRFSDLFVLDEASTFSTNGSPTNVAPTAAFGFVAGGGLSVVLDAAASFDPDPSPEVRPGDDGIVAYAWDLDGDGAYDDAYGRTLTLSYDTPGDYAVALKVWDDDGEFTTIADVISVVVGDYANPWVDGDFSAAGPFAGEHYNIWSGRRGEGWIARDVVRNPAGFAEIGTPQFGLGGFAQLVRDEHVRRGEQTFSFDAINTNATGPTNVLRVRLFGVNGQWELTDGAPSPIHLMSAPEVTTLVDANLGPADLPVWQTQAFDVDLGAAGYEYLVINLEYFGYDEAQGDYFALDNFDLQSPAPMPALAWLLAETNFDDPQSKVRSAFVARDERPAVLPAPRDDLLLTTSQSRAESGEEHEAASRPIARDTGEKASTAANSSLDVAFAQYA